MRPEDPKDEPKRTTHIDGSNGSAAPAVFQKVQSPKESPGDSSRKSPCDGLRGCGSVFTKLNNADISLTPLIEKRPLTSVENVRKNRDLYHTRRKSASTDSLYVNVTRKQSKDSLKSEKHCHSADCEHQLAAAMKRQQYYKSSPNLSSCNSECSRKGRYCVACRYLIFFNN